MAIPGKELVGEHSAIIGDGVYWDFYMAELNREFETVNGIFGEYREAIASGEHVPVARITMDTLGKIEYERHLVALVMTAARTGEWRAVERGPQHRPGLSEVVNKGFGYVVEHEGKKFLLPSAQYLEYCREQLFPPSKI